MGHLGYQRELGIVGEFEVVAAGMTADDPALLQGDDDLRVEVFHPIRAVELTPARGGLVLLAWTGAIGGKGGRMDLTVRFQETLRRLAMIDEGFVEDEAGLGLGPAGASALDPKTVALLQVAVSVAIGSPGVCLEWSAGRALGAGATEDEIADVLLAIAPVAGLGRVVAAAPDVAIALGYDIAAALEEPGGP
jgi:4-carboxymuconolactone decarboxylase